MKKTIYLICLLIVASYSQLFSYDIKKENTLLQQLNSAPNDTTKLAILYELVTVTNDEQSRNTHYTNMLLEEATEQNNSYYKCKAYMSHIITAFNMYDVEKVQKWVELLEPEARKAKLYSIMFEGKRAAIDILNTQGQYELAEKEAEKMLKEGMELKSDIGIAYAYQSLGYVSAFNFKYKESADYFEKSYDIFNKLNRLSSIEEICDRLIGIYKILNDYPKRLNAIEKQNRIVVQQSDSSRYFINYLNYLNYYIDTDNIKEADKYMQLVDKHYARGYIVYDDLYRSARISYFKKKKNLPQAITEIDTLTMITTDALSKCGLELQKAQLLNDMGYTQLALGIYKKIWPIKDSLRIDLINKQTSQLKDSYNADAILLKKQEISHITHIAFIALISTILLGLIWFMVHTYRVQRTLSKAKKEQQKLNHEIELANSAKEKFIANINVSIRKPLNSILKNSLILASNQKLNQKEQQTISQNITTTSGQLIKLINNILDLSNLETKMMKYNIFNIELTSILKSIAAEKSSITIQIDNNNLIWVKADNNRLTQVLKSVVELSRSTDQISINITQTEKESVDIVINESLLSSTNPSQEIIINNEINSMIISDFNGTYKINPQLGVISITLPSSNM